MKTMNWVLVCMVGIVCGGGLVSCTWLACKEEKIDVVTRATPAYAAGNRGSLPPACEGYEVLGIREGIKGWTIRYDGVVLRGGEFYNDQAADALKAWGIKTIISITPNDKERGFCKHHGLVLVEVAFDKTPGPRASDLTRFLDAIKTGQGPFYVHCVGGTHRAGVLGVAYRVHHLGWPFDRALVEFGRLGGDLKENHALLEAVRNYKP